MITYVTGSIFDSPAQTLVNPINTDGVMGGGIALGFRQRYPEMFARYREHCASGALQVGKLWVYRTPERWVLNLPTKRRWRDPSRLEWVDAGLRRFVETYEAQGIKSVAFPMLGCGLGRLSWSDVQPVMEHYLGAVDVPVFVHVPDDGVDSRRRARKGGE